VGKHVSSLPQVSAGAMDKDLVGMLPRLEFDSSFLNTSLLVSICRFDTTVREIDNVSISRCNLSPAPFHQTYSVLLVAAFVLFVLQTCSNVIESYLSLSQSCFPVFAPTFPGPLSFLMPIFLQHVSVLSNA